jgi:hypothetical protein
MKRLSYEEYCKLISTLHPQIQKIRFLPISSAERAVLKDELILKHTVGTNYQADSVRYLIMGLMRTIKAKCS